MWMCKAKRSGLTAVLVLRRTEEKTTYVGYTKKRYFISSGPNIKFDELYGFLDYYPPQAAELWINSTIPMPERVRKELEMIVYTSKRKIIAVLEDGAEAPEGAVNAYGSVEDLAGKDIKDLLKILNLAKGKDEKVKKFVEGEIPSQVAWDALVNFEVPEPVEKVRISASVKDTTVFTALDNSRNKKDSVRTKVFDALASLKGGAGTAAEIADVMGDMDAKTVKGYLRPLVTDGKVEAVTPEVEAPAAA